MTCNIHFVNLKQLKYHKEMFMTNPVLIIQQFFMNFYFPQLNFQGVLFPATTFEETRFFKS